MKKFWVYYMFRHYGLGTGYPVKTIGYGKDSESAIQFVKDYMVKYPENCSGFSAKPHRGKW